MERFVNKNVFLTGAASGIGKATARRLANEGAKLIIADVNQKLLDETSKELKDSVLETYTLDISNVSDIAKIFEELGGKVIYYGKPHEEIYKMCFKQKEKVLAIGDNLRTDIKGANNLNKDCLFISNGVHRNEFSNNVELEKLLDKYKVRAHYFQKELQW